jgi:anti-sigma factor RsiW
MWKSGDRNKMQKGSCKEWQEKLVAIHTDDLTQGERAALEKHLSSCPACRGVWQQDREIDALVRSYDSGDVIVPAFPSKLRRLCEWMGRQT